ncbi:DUF6515 family protein [Biformimicrobium ophioploci]|uniref:RcnB family protein n=1 Tax=Biformimicrobium ophioploci TaxID=3036711 RepID=A0ABQ6LUX4_9GAMM|nr:DUF6515 family protein [Microbulbifer sp. NKW57]GMG85851.1 hypothetical protein MNKW57_01720 [Microbulbifer sp. NKW57]
MSGFNNGQAKKNGLWKLTTAAAVSAFFFWPGMTLADRVSDPVQQLSTDPGYGHRMHVHPGNVVTPRHRHRAKPLHYNHHRPNVRPGHHYRDYYGYQARHRAYPRRYHRPPQHYGRGLYHRPSHYHYGYYHRRLPPSYVTFRIGNRPLYYSAGIYYRPHYSGFVVARPPYGLTVRRLPDGAARLRWRNGYYYVAYGTFYKWDRHKRGYRVVVNPGFDRAGAFR